MKKSKIYILFGSNIGNKKQYILDAQNLVKQNIGEIIAESSLYESEAWGFACDDSFLNKIIVVESNLNAFEILDITQKIELQLGRVRETTNSYQSRTIDIDILFYDNKILETENLTIPHPQIQNRKFTLIPLAEIASDFVHPKLQKTILELLKKCNDNGCVTIIK
jgi:2-amino-4-hydroxy-6-hydroxymethyldihydropteridine pyrophosphokinase